MPDVYPCPISAEHLQLACPDHPGAADVLAADSTPVTLAGTAVVTVSAAPIATLPETGVGTLSLGIVGVAALAGGAVLVRLSRLRCPT